MRRISPQEFSVDPIHPRSSNLLLPTILLFVFTAVTEAEGNRWIFRGPARTNVTVLIDPLVSTVLYAQSGDTLFRSLDAAATWQLMTGALPGAAALLVSPEAPNTLYARHFNSSGRSEIFRSSDGGATWAQLPKHGRRLDLV